MAERTWTDKELIEIMNGVPKSWANVCRELGLKAIYSNTKRIKKKCEELGLPTKITWRYSYTKDELREAVKNNGSYRQVLLSLGMNEYGSAYKYVKKAINELGLDTTHFHHQAWRKGNKGIAHNEIPIEEVLIEDYQGGITSSSLKRKLFKYGLFEKKCYNCNRTAWMNNSIPLQLHHKNGDSKNNTIDNLTILCPNCHSLTDTWTSKNVSSKPKKSQNKKGQNKKDITYETIIYIKTCPNCSNEFEAKEEKQIYCCKKCYYEDMKKDIIKTCPVCKKEFNSNRKNQKYCSTKCYYKSCRKVERPSKEKLEKEISENTWSALGKKYGVSGNAVKKWAKKYKII